MILPKFQDLEQLKHISHVLTKHGFGFMADKLKLPRISSCKKVTKKIKGEHIRLIFEELGTSFIKLGQFLSTRPDLISGDIIIELKKLQDQVPPFAFEEVEIQFKKEFKSPIKKIFKEFATTPIASASIGQVYLAKLYTGEDVVVKVQRPDLEKETKKDIELFFFLASLLEKHLPDSKLYDPIGLVEEFRKQIKKEINFETEAHNLEKIKQSFRNDENLYFPEIYREYTNTKFLVMEYVDGIKVKDLKKLNNGNYDRQLIARIGAKAIFKQIFEDGIFHADPHSGNILILPQNRICFIDYGIVGHLNKNSKSFLTNILIAIIENNEEKLIEAMIEENTVPTSCNITELKNKLKNIFIDYANLPLEQIDVLQLINDIVKIISAYRIHIDSHLFLVIKSLITIEGIGRQLDPEFNPIVELKPFVKNMILNQYSPEKIGIEFGSALKENFHLLKTLPKDIHIFLRDVTRGSIKINFEHKGLEQLNHTLKNSSNRFSFSIVMAAFIIASALIIQSNTPPFLWDIPILGVAGFVLSGIIGFILLISIVKKD